MEACCNAGLLADILARACDATVGAQPLRDAKLVCRAWKAEATHALQRRTIRFGDCDAGNAGDALMTWGCAWCHHNPAMFVATYTDSTLRFFDALTGRCTHRLVTLGGGTGAPQVVASRRNDRGEARPLLCVIACSGASLVTLPAPGAGGAALPVARRLCYGVTLKADFGNDLLFVASIDRIRVYDTRTRTLDVVFTCPNEFRVLSAHFSPSGDSLVMCFSHGFDRQGEWHDAVINIVDTTTWTTRQLTPFKRILRTQWIPNSPLLVSGNDAYAEKERVFSWDEDADADADADARSGGPLAFPEFEAFSWSSNGSIATVSTQRDQFQVVRSNGARTEVKYAVLQLCVEPDGRALLAIVRLKNGGYRLSVLPVP